MTIDKYGIWLFLVNQYDMLTGAKTHVELLVGLESTVHQRVQQYYAENALDGREIKHVLQEAKLDAYFVQDLRKVIRDYERDNG